MKSRSIILLVLLLAFASTAFAQQDSSYYEVYTNVLHGRVGVFQKFNTLYYKNTLAGKSVSYLPNIIPGITVGFTYNWMTINLSYGFRLDGQAREKGQTKYYDVQIHSYPKKFIIDVFAQAYTGMYVPGDKDADGNFYYRPDLESRVVGGEFQYVFNNKRFSFRSSLLQNGWQKKSAGSFLFGVETFVGRVTADSSLLPFQPNADPDDRLAKKDFFWQVGPTIGYAYTGVFKKRFFLTGSFSESFNYGRRVFTEGSEKTVVSKFVTNPSYRVIVGYNAHRWGVALYYVNNKINFPGAIQGHELAVRSGIVRLNFVYRFRKKGKLGEVIDKIR